VCCESFVKKKKKKMHTMSSFSLPMVEVGSLSATRSMLSFRLDSQPATLSRFAWRLRRRKGVEIISLCFQPDLQDHQRHHHRPLTFAAAGRGASIVAWALKARESVTNNNNKRWICTVASPPMSDVETSQESEVHTHFSQGCIKQFSFTFFCPCHNSTTLFLAQMVDDRERLI
jgi:hypothetical protein